MASIDQRSDGQILSRLRRRQFMSGGVLAAAAMLARPSVSAAAVDTTSWNTHVSGGADGARVKYPPRWSLDPSSSRQDSLDSSLLYPHQSFSVRTAPGKPVIDTGMDDSGLPDLNGYPTDAAIIWLLYYDVVVAGPTFSGTTLADLQPLVSSPSGHRAYKAVFSNSVRSFLLRVWVGNTAPSAAVAAVDSSLRTLSLPS